MRVRPMRPERTMHYAEYRVEDIAIKAGKAHSLPGDTVSLMPLDASYRSCHWARGCHFGVVTESPAISQWIIGNHRYRHSVLLGDLGADRVRALVLKREQ